MYILRKKPVYTLRYLPKFLANDEVFKNTALINDKQHEKLKIDLLDLKNQIFIESATWRLADWERVLNISVKPNATIEERRAQILLKFRGASPVTQKFMNELINLFCKNNTGYIVPHYSEYTFDINADADDEVDWKGLIECVKLYKPAHLGYGTVLKILQHQDTNHKNFTTQYINALHNFWNLGSLESVYWDGVRTWDGSILWSGYKPDNLYKDRQTHLLDISFLLTPTLKINTTQKLQSTYYVNSKYKKKISHANASISNINSKLKNTVNLKNIETAYIEPKQNRTALIKNCWNGSFCLDGSHILNGAYEIDKQMENICVFYSTKHGIVNEGSREIL